MLSSLNLYRSSLFPNEDRIVVQLTLHSVVQRLQILDEEITRQTTRKPLITILKLILIGFYLDKRARA